MQSSWETSYFARRYQQTLTDLLLSLQNEPEILHLFTEAYPDLWDDLCDKGYRCLELSQTTQAEAIFSFLYASGGDHDPAVSAALGDSFSLLRRYIEAAEMYEKTIALSPEIPDAWLSLAEHWMILQQPHNALQRLEGALALLEDQADHPYLPYLQKCLTFAREAVQDLDTSRA